MNDLMTDVPSELARRVGPVLAGVALVVTIGLVTWMSLAPTDVAGPLSEAAYELDALLVLPPGEDGCAVILDGQGSERSYCMVEAQDGQAFFDADGLLVVGGYGPYPDEPFAEDVEAEPRVEFPIDNGTFVRLDPDTLEVVSTATGDDLYGDGPFFDDRERRWVWTDGSKIVDGDSEEVLLDVGGPPGYRLDQASISPDGRWFVASDVKGRVLVAPADGSGDIRIWTDLPAERPWIDLSQGVLWR